MLTALTVLEEYIRNYEGLRKGLILSKTKEIFYIDNLHNFV